MKILVVCAPGIGDALILHIASHHLSLAGHEVITDTPHRFGRWLASYQFGTPDHFDAVFLQHDNSEKSKLIYKLPKQVYTFFGSHHVSKHGKLREGFDFVCNQDKTMVENVVDALRSLFFIDASKNNGFKTPPELVHRKYRKRVAIHTTSSSEEKNWPFKKFEKVARWLVRHGYEPAFLPQFPSLEALCSFIYESAFFLGNDSGPGHIASCLNIPHLIIGPDQKQLKFWRPGWNQGQIAIPPSWSPRKYWKHLLSANKVIKSFKNNTLCN